jgi:hypothetical protein
MHPPSPIRKTIGLTTLAMIAFAANSLLCRIALVFRQQGAAHSPAPIQEGRTESRRSGPREGRLRPRRPPPRRSSTTALRPTPIG